MSLSEERKDGQEGRETKMEAMLVERDDIRIESKAKVSTKGQVVIPIEIRRALGISDDGNQEVIFTLRKDGTLCVEKVEEVDVEELFSRFEGRVEKGYVLDKGAAWEERAEEVLSKKKLGIYSLEEQE
jgi:AbrB family looped-hinge helix DNA binding protein